MKDITVYFVGNSPTINFTAHETAKYLKKITGNSVTCQKKTEYNDKINGVWLCSPAKTKDIGDNNWNDQIEIKSKSGHVRISGSNDRSVLFALYDWLESLGCQWIMPGEGGEIIPSINDPFSIEVDKNESASYKHRCICIEGSCSKEHVLNMLDFAVKRKFNAYFLQFRNSFTFFDRWYGLEKNRAPVKTPFYVKEAEKICAIVKSEAMKRGMILHTVGHGWTCEPFGIPGLEWAPFRKKISPAVKKYFAMVNGKRELWHGVPLNTQLCYSNPQVREIMAKAVVDYAASHPNEKIIHVWLADGSNNFCECRNCCKYRHSDLYVKLLNRIDELLTNKGINTKIVFLAYVDLLWAPLKEKIKNDDRFILMFAPITRSYALPFISAKKTKKEKLSPWKRNKLVFPSTPQGNLELFHKWQRSFQGERVDFDYHLWRAWAYDLSQLQISEILHSDIQSLQKMGMNGFISCQVQRLFFPTALPMYIMGQMLWNRNKQYNNLVFEHFQQIYGNQWRVVLAYFEKIKKLTHPPFLRGEKDKSSKKQIFDDWQKAFKVIDNFMKKLENEKNFGGENNRFRRLLQLHAEYTKRIITIALLAFRADKKASVEYDDFAAWLDEHLPELADVLDTWMVKAIVQDWLRLHGIAYKERVIVR